MPWWCHQRESGGKRKDVMMDGLLRRAVLADKLVVVARVTDVGSG